MLRPGISFLNHGSFGACPRPVFERYQQWQSELEGQPVEFLGRRLPGLLAEARTALGSFLGAAADDLVFVPNATHGVNIVARSLGLGPGDEVLGSDHEYGAVDRTWRFICAQRGAHYVRSAVRLPVEDPDEVVAAIGAGITERTRAICVSHITSPTGLIFPVAEICRRAREAGIITIVDGAHAPGQLDLDLGAVGADFYTGNCHKWLCAPKGAGFLYARPEVQPLLAPLIVSWGWEAVVRGPSPFVDYFGWTGTMDPAAYLSVPTAIDFQARHEWPAVRAACHGLLAVARQRLAALTGLPQICPASPDWFAQMATLPLPLCDALQLKAHLWDAFRVEVPIIEWGGRQFVRVSVQAYNSPADIDRLMEAIAAYPQLSS